MNTEELASYTKDLLREHGVDLDVNPDALRAMGTSSMERVDSRASKTTHRAKAGQDFKIPNQASSMPYITGLDGQNMTLMSYEPGFKTWRAHSWAFGSADTLKASRLYNFKSEIGNINRSRFTEGIDLDNMILSNIKNEPLGRVNLERTLRSGAILPLSSRRGIFMPAFGMSPNYFSIEFEGRFKTESGAPITFDSLTRDPVKKNFGVDITNLLSYDMGDSNSYKAYYDGSISRKAGRHAQEVVLGAAPQSNLILAADMQFAAWKKEGLLDPRDVVMDRSAGMHVSTTIPNMRNDNRGQMSSYLNNAGLVIDMLGRHADRWKSTDYLGVSNTYDSGRNNFRMDSNTKRLEFRHPGAIASTGYFASQLALTGKMANDLVGFGPELRDFPTSSGRARGMLKLKGSRTDAIRDSPFAAIHAQSAGAEVMQDWFNSFTDHLGITDPVQKKFMLMMNNACTRTKSSYF